MESIETSKLFSKLTLINLDKISKKKLLLRTPRSAKQRKYVCYVTNVPNLGEASIVSYWTTKQHSQQIGGNLGIDRIFFFHFHCLSSPFLIVTITRNRIRGRNLFYYTHVLPSLSLTLSLLCLLYQLKNSFLKHEKDEDTARICSIIDLSPIVFTLYRAYL